MPEVVETPQEIPIQDQLKSYIGQFVCLLLPNGNHFGQLSTNDTHFGVPPVGFTPEAVKEIRKIEVEPEKNLVRAVIVL